HLTVASVGVRSAGRRRGRSLATVTLLACGVFLLIAVSAFHQQPVDDPTIRSSGTGGFTLLGEAQLPLLHDLAEARAQEELGLDAEKLPGVSFVPMRVREGDDASCLNLNRAQQPRLLGVAPDLLRERGAFRFTRLHESVASQGATGWDALDVELAP